MIAYSAAKIAHGHTIRQVFFEVHNPAVHRGNAFGGYFFGIDVEHPLYDIEIRLKQQCAMMHHPAIFYILCVTGKFAAADRQIVSSADLSLNTHLQQHLQNRAAECAEIYLHIFCISNKSIIEIAEIVVHCPSSG